MGRYDFMAPCKATFDIDVIYDFLHWSLARIRDDNIEIIISKSNRFLSFLP